MVRRSDHMSGVRHSTPQQAAAVARFRLPPVPILDP